MRQHLNRQLRPRLQCRQATRTRPFSSAPSRWSLNNDNPGNRELGAPSQPWGRFHNLTFGHRAKAASILATDPKAYERMCLERNYPAAAKYPGEINRLRQIQRENAPSQHYTTERYKAVQYLLKRIASEQEPEDTWLRDASRPARKGLVEMTKERLLEEAKSLKEEVTGMKEYIRTIQWEVDRLGKSLPNIISPETPRGKSPKVVGYINDHPKESPFHSARSHTLIGEELELLDFAMAGVTTGWGWYYLLNEAAQLEQALIQYALSVARKGGWGVVSPPSMVYSEISSSCGFQPRDQNGEQQVYSIQKSIKDEKKPERSLAGTSEIPLAAMLASRAISPQNLPKKHVAVSRCYRAEAGARGLGSKGLYRVHEFTKVEMFAWTYPTDEASTAIFDEIHRIQIEILTSLGLHCRILEMPSGDLGASATRKRDIEAFFPSRSMDEGFGEVTSVSTCTDYQSAALSTVVEGLEKAVIPDQTKRLDADTDGTGSNKTPQSKHPFTVNGTALAVPRVLAAILENGWNEEKREVAIPECLWPWMDGVKVISSKRTTIEDSIPAAAVEDPLVPMDNDIPSESQEDQLVEIIEEDESLLEEEPTTFGDLEESEVTSGSEQDPTDVDEMPIESQDPVPVVEENELSGEAPENQPISNTQTEEASSSVERADSDEIATEGKASEVSPSAEVLEDISSIGTQTDEATQSAKEPSQNENVPPNETKTTEETQPSEKTKNESAAKSMFSKFLGR